MCKATRRTGPNRPLLWLRQASILLLGTAVCVQGQLGFDVLGATEVVSTTPPPPPPLRLSEVAKQRTFEHHAAARLHPSSNASAPAPSAPSGAPEPGQGSMYDLLAPTRMVGGVANAMAPLAAAPLALPPSGMPGLNGSSAQAPAPQPAVASAPQPGAASLGAGAATQQPLLPGNASSGGEVPAGVLSVIDLLPSPQPPPPEAFITPDGSVIFTGPTPGLGGTAAGRSTFDMYFWPTVALLGLLAIVGSLIWAFSSRRSSARRYIDLKDTEMAMQQRETRTPHDVV